MNTTWTFMFVTVVVWIIFDVYIINKKGKSGSISANIIRAVNKNRLNFFVVFALGVVFGHLFWSMPTESVYENVKCKDAIKWKRSQ